MKGYCTKYALTKGIFEVNVKKPGSAYHGDDGEYVYTIDRYPMQLKVGRDFFHTIVEAEANARERARKKIVSLEDSLARMKNGSVHPYAREWTPPPRDRRAKGQADE